MKPLQPYPSIFVNHGGGPLPLMGRQPDVVQHIEETVTKWLPSERPKAIVVISAHWESDPIKITSSPQPSMLFDYYDFPPYPAPGDADFAFKMQESLKQQQLDAEQNGAYQYNYPAPGNVDLAFKIHQMLKQAHLDAELDGERGFDHGVFVPLMLMYPDADIPTVCVSLHSSLSADIHWKIGTALAPLRDDGILILGSGFSYHNIPSLVVPTAESFQASNDFNDWLKEVLLHGNLEQRKSKLLEWDQVPSARMAHPREEHLLPLIVVAATASTEPKTTLIYDVLAGANDVLTATNGRGHAKTSYMFE